MLTQAFVSLLVAGLGLALATPDLSVDLAARQNADSSSLLGSLVQSLPTKVKLGSFTYDAKNVTSKDGTSIVIEAIGDRSKPHVVFAHGKSILHLPCQVCSQSIRIGCGHDFLRHVVRTPRNVGVGLRGKYPQRFLTASHDLWCLGEVRYQRSWTLRQARR
jgi:hypothetical protein